MNHATGTYEVKRLAQMGAMSVWHVIGNNVDRKVSIGGTMLAVTALTRALEEEAEDKAYLESLSRKRLAGG
jgi:hypothetical protein